MIFTKRIKANSHFTVLAGICLALCGSLAAAQQIEISQDASDGVYPAGQPMSWHVRVSGDGAGNVKSANYVVKRCGQTPAGSGTIDLSSGKADVTAALNEPGTLLLQITAQNGEKTIKASAGAAVEPGKVQPAAPRPGDFDAFWAEQIGKLNAVRLQADVEPVATPSAGANVDYYKVQLLGYAGSQIYTQLARPKAEGKYPALLILQWAGVYGLPASRVTDRAKGGWLAMNVMAHAIPLDMPDEVYKRLTNTVLREYYSIGNHDRTTSYFLRMYMSAYRAADYLTSRPDWDGKTLVVMGTSQGGQQTIMLTGLYPKVTTALAMVPSSCDVAGQEIGRAIGYPNWADSAKQHGDSKILETGRYYDPVNFASHITCPALIGLGLKDETSPPTGVFAAINQMKGPTERFIMRDSGHQDEHGTQAGYNRRAEEWLRALVKGQPAPVRAAAQ